MQLEGRQPLLVTLRVCSAAVQSFTPATALPQWECICSLARSTSGVHSLLEYMCLMHALPPAHCLHASQQACTSSGGG